MKTAVAALFAGMVGCTFVQPVPAAQAARFKERVLWSFGNGSDGQYPSALINMKGILYGTTSAGGTGSNCAPYGCGAVFALNRKTDAETLLYSFCSQQNCADGKNPEAGLTAVRGTLYGTTFWGGSAGHGTTFALHLRTAREKVLYSFCSLDNCTDGSNPTSLINVNGMLYGTTETGGTTVYGTAFMLDPKTGTETVLYAFCQQANCVDGQNPDPALIDVDGALYGTTVAGGAYGYGTVFAIDPNTGVETVLHSFGNGTDGQGPDAGLSTFNGTLYGTTSGGGHTNGCGGLGCGTVFSIDPNTGAEKVLYSFCSQQNCTDGAIPYAGLIAVNGALYGTTDNGGRAGCGSFGCGTVFSIDPNSGTETVLYSFCRQQNCTDGANPYASLIDVNGRMYGTTGAGGVYGYGTIFVLKQKR